MKNQAYTMIAMLVLVGSMAVAAQAQTSSRTDLRANIPFQFNVGGQTLPAGEYRVLSISAESSNVVLKFESHDGKGLVLLQMMTVKGKAQESSKLIFHRYGNKYFFAEAWVDGDANGLQALKSRAERGAEREMAGIKAKTETVALLAR